MPFASLIVAAALTAVAARPAQPPPVAVPVPVPSAPAAGAPVLIEPGLVKPTPRAIPKEGAVPRTWGADGRFTAETVERWPGIKDYTATLRQIKHQYFGTVRNEAKRKEGLATLKGLTPTEAMVPMYNELRAEGDDVVLAMLDMYAERGDAGQAALAWIAINDEDARLRNEAKDRIRKPASPAVLGVLDASLRSNVHMVANRAGSLAGALGAIETIPLLIFGQATRDRVEQQGDLAWIAIGTQKSYIANVVPILGDASGGFQPIVGVITEGVLLRITDAFVVSYRTDIHSSLVAMTTSDWGKSTDYLGYDMKAWWQWYNDEYIPFKAQQATDAAKRARIEDLQRKADEADLD